MMISKNFSLAALGLLIIVNTAYAEEQTSSTDLTSFSNNLTVNMTPEQIQRINELATAPENKCPNTATVTDANGSGFNFTFSNPLDSSPDSTKIQRQDSDIKIRVNMAITNLHPDIARVVVGCIVNKTSSSAASIDQIADMGALYKHPAFGAAACDMPKDLSSGIVDIPILIPVGDQSSEYGTYSCTLWFQSDNQEVKANNSQLKPVWSRATEGSNLMIKMSGILVN